MGAQRVSQARRIGEQGRYELIEEIESGGMGTVWRGYDAVLDREIAVKLIRPDVVASPAQAAEFARRFEREARVTARIGHHGVPQVFDAVLDEASYDRLYLVMEYVRGIPLRRVLTETAEDGAAARLPVSWAASIAAQVCTVLSYAHAIPVVHRDLKPDNVLIAADGTVKVLDFGIAKLLRTDVTRLTATGSRIGTSRYMSPEQIDCARITPLSDLYALGCVLHELLAGEPVFSGNSEYQLLQQHMDEPPKPLRTLRPEVPEDLEALALDLLAKVPEQRPADAYAVYERLSPHLPQPGSAAEPVVLTHDGSPSEAPDPTVVYRQPNAPLRRTTPPAPSPGPVTPVPVRARIDTALRDAIKDAYSRSADLADSGRFAQAADVLKAVIATAATALGADNPRVLGLRRQRAAVLMAGEDFRRALPEFDALAAVYARTAGPADENTLECRRHAAHCRANLGQATVALREFQEVLEVVSDEAGDASETALDLRRSIGVLLFSDGRRAEAENVLDALHEDMCVVLGEDHEETREIADLLARLRGPEGPSPY
ncbi:protein kinase [Streptomyces sp. NPDC059900]|uniref:serine/threonine-protein kinase n=1 Tax=Streptomyces sp. NPDC059900 TaxID=3155816 RepID=UPI003449DC36